MSSKGKHSEPSAGNVYAKSNEVIVKIPGGDTNLTFEVVEENCRPGFHSRAHYHIKAFERFYAFEGSADFRSATSSTRRTKARVFIFLPECRIKSPRARASACS